ncbi:uncharacterized protein MONOS_9579 [Monocercomonoides exilis]|uniref:uncharacterized protein n=1 Tax=Monocercomonoides exilis TaxID=2049356 RepID=UPI003559D735|nr:hypothetical protein MONOS_9579 [Monocercomonoides exilis]|eukprot:MONOS_9579.1-p1 / transcript=MONOS_9579.1 / gene=MONOS_9579 / organism=Monocercomonoides_exilis_PA203 / gene_product=unspecified product / transcript_product=unspecified product / location=Mono_scaffold00400:49062-49351(+) / protein_length=76 / sequence_SO=supercontig / SO=protein_coding / is_pseudo=false
MSLCLIQSPSNSRIRTDFHICLTKDGCKAHECVSFVYDHQRAKWIVVTDGRRIASALSDLKADDEERIARAKRLH